MTLPNGPAPLPGSTFQGGDGDQDNAPPLALVDWQALQDTDRVVHNPDGGLQFARGSKEDNPGEWSLIGEGEGLEGVNPAKDNIFDAWSAVDQPGADTFLYLGFTRERALGTTTIAFELNQDARTWDNDDNPATPPIPCRRTGDVLIVYDAHGNDINVEVELERWVTETTDPSTGCATNGHLDVPPLPQIAAVSGQGAVNPVPITSHLPGHFPIGAPIPDPRLFGEAALNLTALFEAAKLDSCFSYGSIWMHSRSSRPVISAMQDYLAPKPLALNTCAAAGTKFLDLDANGRRDSGERGLPGFVIWADYDNDGVLDEKEPFTVSDTQGRYVLKNIRPPSGIYRLRETLLVRRKVRGATAWTCSLPNKDTGGGFANGPGGLFGCGWGPITAAKTPFAQDRDFGNWLPAQLTVEKQLWPADDPGRFDLKVNGQTVLPAAGDGATVTGQVQPGSYDITEEAAQGTDPGAYRSSVTCQRTTTRRGSLRAGTGYPGLVLRVGDHATCTFTNVRNAPPPTPAIAIEKAGPTLANAGDTLHYTLYVTNPGDVPFPANSVHVSDPACDEPPERVSTADANGADGSPGTLDPGDTWTYQCSNKTKAPDAACELSTVTNTATASVSANGTNARLHQARQVKDDDSLTTTLNCPDLPPQPPLPDPGPEPPIPFPPPNPTPSPLPPFVPLVPEPPPAGQVGFARVSVPARCITRVSRVKLLGTHISDILVSVDGSRVRRHTLQVLQRSVRPLVVPLAPGRHRVTVHVVFERGSDSPPVTLSTTVNICLAQVIPPVTG